MFQFPPQKFTLRKAVSHKVHGVPGDLSAFAKATAHTCVFCDRYGSLG
jgi:hypothetical protein